MTTRTFTASDWLSAIDVQMRTPPSPPPFDEEPIIAESPPYRRLPDDPTAEAFDDPLATWDTQPAATPRRLRNLPRAIMATCAAGIYMLLLVVTVFAAPTWLLWFALAACVLELLIWLLAAGRFDRL